jgi:uncharacterized protein (DUF2141 family)
MKTTLFTFAFMVHSIFCLAQDAELSITIEGIEKQEGTIYISLHKSENTFPDNNDKSVTNQSSSTFNSQATFNFEGLKEGDYAVSFFQDLNGNKELDTNIFGFPQEPVGASNMSSLARPKFSKCKFSLKGKQTKKVQFMN